MKQLALPLIPPPQPSLDNFFPGRNAELLTALRALAAGAYAERCIYLWGAPGCGRSHLLRAMAAALVAHGLPVAYVEINGAWPELDEAPRALLVDDVDGLDARSQGKFFGLFNQLREQHGIVLSAGSVPPARLSLRPEMVTRLGWGLTYQVFALSDEEKALALKSHAAARAFHLPDDIVDYLLRHVQRDLPNLIGVLDALDRYSLETHRAITLPLVRDLLQNDAASDMKGEDS
ncbi:MAG: DnaA regulatory inactivator Hda [Burkholderiales bacterium]